MNWLDEPNRDYAIVEVIDPICTQAGRATLSTVVNANMTAYAVGYYRHSTINSPPNKRMGTLRREEAEFRIRNYNYNQYRAEGFVTGVYNFANGVDEYIAYEIDQDRGGSGGPIIELNSGYVVGMQIMNGNGNFNIALTPSGPFLEFLREHVPDLSFVER